MIAHVSPYMDNPFLYTQAIGELVVGVISLTMAIWTMAWPALTLNSMYHRIRKDNVKKDGDPHLTYEQTFFLVAITVVALGAACAIAPVWFHLLFHITH